MTKFIILMDGAIAGWGLRHALVKFSNGDMVWGTFFLALGIILFLIVLFLLVRSDV
jgi:hypothetical protein